MCAYFEKEWKSMLPIFWKLKRFQIFVPWSKKLGLKSRMESKLGEMRRPSLVMDHFIIVREIESENRVETIASTVYRISFEINICDF